MGIRTNTAKWVESKSMWRIDVQKDSVRRSFYSSKAGRTGQREANAKADAWLDDGIESRGVRCDDVAKQWIEELQTRTSKSHWSKASEIWRNHCSNLYRKKPENISEQDLQDTINSAYRKGLSSKTIKNVHDYVKAFIKYCRKRKLSSLNPEFLIIPKNAPEKEKNILQPDDLEKLFLCDTSIINKKEQFEPLVYAWRLQVLTGLRPGELLGLQWDDINTNSITINRSINKWGEITPGKNKNARRTVPLAKDAATLLTQWEKLSNKKHQFVFTDKFGESFKLSAYYTHWKKYQIHANIQAKSDLYGLRHTFASINKELPDNVLKMILGHSVNMNTYKTYIHHVDGDSERAGKLVQVEFNKARKVK